MIASRGILRAAPQSASANPAQRGADGDLVIVNGKFVDGRGVVASALTIKDGQVVNGKSILGLMMLAAAQGSSIEVTTSGAQAAEALAAIEQLVEEKFYEE